jgi:hypothetical protein
MAGHPEVARAGARAPFARLTSIFAVVAVAVAAARTQQPFEHGWWLVAYLALVGGLSQFLLGMGQLALAPAWTGSPAGRRALIAELVLWNGGTVLVPVGVLAASPQVVAAGSAVLLVALAMFVAGTTARRLTCADDRRRWVYSYRAIVVLLTASVIVGAGLADALPWQ